jgi:hypothetical protein
MYFLRHGVGDLICAETVLQDRCKLLFRWPVVPLGNNTRRHLNGRRIVMSVYITTLLELLPLSLLPSG